MAAEPRYHSQAPCPALRPFVRRFAVVEHAHAVADQHWPAAAAVAAFTFRGGCRHDGGEATPNAALTGLRQTVRHHAHGAGHSVALAMFTPVGAAAFLRPSQAEFAGLTVDLRGELADAAELDALRERLDAAAGHRQRVRLLEAFLLARLRADAPDPLAAAAVTWLETAPPQARIQALGRHLGLSQSALERRFKRAVGLSPKRYASLLRLQRALRLQAGGGLDLAQLALEAGYYDQAHFHHEFKRAAGCAPSIYFARHGG